MDLVMPRRSSPKSKPPETPSGSIFQLKIRLLEVSPMIWRRVLLPASYTLEELHGLIQVTMGWEGIHLYQFRIRAVHYGSFDLCVSSPRVTLDHFRFRKGAKFTYDYDMTDFWRHEIRVEDRLELEPGRSCPVCIDGAHACPPEECGGPEGYADRRLEAFGLEAMDDLATLADLVEAIVVEKRVGLLDDPETRWELERALERSEVRQPFLAETFSRQAVNGRLLQDEHHVLLHQRLW
jgi:hypothetical protein